MLALGALSVVATPGCGRPAPVAPAAPPPVPLHLKPLSDLVAAAGLSWIVIARPSELRRSATFNSAIAQLIPEQNLTALSGYLGFDARQAETAIVAGSGDSVLTLIEVAHDPKLVEKKFVERVTSTVERVDEGRGLIRLTGTIGTRRRALALLEPSVIAWESGPSGPMRATVAFALGKLKKAKPALLAEPLLTLSKKLGDAPLIAMAPSPTRDAWSGAHGLLDRATAIGVAATPGLEGLQVTLIAMGTWDDPPTEALHRLEATLKDLATSPLGRLTAIDHPLTPWSVDGDRDVIHATATFDADKIGSGLRAATSAQIREIVGP